MTEGFYPDSVRSLRLRRNHWWVDNQRWKEAAAGNTGARSVAVARRELAAGSESVCRSKLDLGQVVVALFHMMRQMSRYWTSLKIDGQRDGVQEIVAGRLLLAQLPHPPPSYPGIHRCVLQSWY